MPTTKKKTSSDKGEHRGEPKQEISVALVDFSEPLLELLDDKMPSDTFEEIFQIAVTVWNAVVLDSLNSTSKFTDNITASIQKAGMPLMVVLVKDLIERKRKLYGDDLRIIGDYQVSLDEQGKLQVTAEVQISPATPE